MVLNIRFSLSNKHRNDNQHSNTWRNDTLRNRCNCNTRHKLLVLLSQHSASASNAILLSVVMLRLIFSVVMLNAVMLNVVLLNVVAPQ
jgi:hypothetical protein